MKVARRLQGHLMEPNRRKGPASLPPGEEGQAPRPDEEVLEPAGRRQRLLTVRGAADYLGVSRATVERLVSRGQRPSSRLVPPPATTSWTLTDSSQRTGPAIADGRPDAVT